MYRLGETAGKNAITAKKIPSFRPVPNDDVALDFGNSLPPGLSQNSRRSYE
jgi:hypothetical protein